MNQHTFVDSALVTMLLVAPIVEWRWTWPRFLARLVAGVPGTRLRHYRYLLVGEWLPTLFLVLFWGIRSRPWSALYLTAGALSLRFWLGLAYVALIIAILLIQRRALLAKPERIDRLRKALAFGEPLLPHTPQERSLFLPVSVAAGVCEEIFYRGFLTWYLTAWMGLIPAILIAAILFGLGHVYMGPLQVPKTAFVGLVFAFVVWLSGSLWPAMLLHAAIDWNSGELGYRVFTQPQPSGT
jgi:membrane protease YdiL (CAAX protease family)